MAVLVAYASTHGSTKEIAERLAARLVEQGLAAQGRPAADVTDLSGYGAFVVGSAIHGGQWLPEGAALLDRGAAALARHPVWLFSVSTVGEASSAYPSRVAGRLRAMRNLPQAVATLADQVPPRAHHDFAGVIRPDHWGLGGRVFLRVLGGRFGDHRDWQEIDGWAMAIAGQLRSAQPRPA
jgi:menaquinone-dependent protoporphyrinogen oxidase